MGIFPWPDRLKLITSLACAAGLFPFAGTGAEPASISGITEPFLDVTLSPPVSGIISAEFFKEGQTVKKGEVILQLDRRLEELEEARRKAVMERAKTDYDSTMVLVQTTKSVSKEELGKKEMDYKVAVADHDIAAEQLARRQIVAPFSGSISEISLQVGGACAPYQPVIRLVDTSRFYFVGHLEGKVASSLRLDDQVKIQVDGLADPVAGKVCYISPVVDPASGLAKIKALCENPDAKVRPGLAAKLSVR